MHYKTFIWDFGKDGITGKFLPRKMKLCDRILLRDYNPFLLCYHIYKTNDLIKPNIFVKTLKGESRKYRVVIINVHLS